MDGLLGGERHIEGTVEGHQTWVHFVVRTAGGRDASNVHHIDDLAEIEVTTTLVELVSLNEELEERVGWLRSINVNLRHVEVVNEHDHFLSNCAGTVILDGLLLDILLDNGLEVSGGSLGREVDVQEGISVSVKTLEGRLDSDGFGST